LGQAHAAGLWPSRWVTLQVPGRRTGRTISFLLAVADYQGERYLVAMLGEGSSWVRNVRAAGGRVVLRHGRRETVHLEEVDPAARPPILRRYLWVAPGLVPIYRSIAMLRSKTLSGSRRSFLSFA
jgi:hypothetical protein